MANSEAPVRRANVLQSSEKETYCKKSDDRIFTVSNNGLWELMVSFITEDCPMIEAEQVCKYLGLQNVALALKNVPDKWKAKIRMPIVSEESCDISTGYTTSIPKRKARKTQDKLFVSQAGFYQLVFQSKRPEAVAYKEWVFEVALPTLTKAVFDKMRRKELKVDYKQLSSVVFSKSSNKEDAIETIKLFADMINKATTGMTSHDCKEKYGLTPRDYITKSLLKSRESNDDYDISLYEKKLGEYDRLQRIVKEEVDRGQAFERIKATLIAMGYKV